MKGEILFRTFDFFSAYFQQYIQINNDKTRKNEASFYSLEEAMLEFSHNPIRTIQ